MKKKQKKAQIILISIGLLLILITYFYYPYAKKIKFAENEAAQIDSLSTPGTDHDTSFEHVMYQGSYESDTKFTVSSEEAHILDDEPELVYMKKMKVLLYLSNNQIVTISSDLGKYHKQSHDCWFEKNVVAADGETKIFAENLDLLATENLLKIYNNVIINSSTGSLNADSAVYDFETKYMRVGMFDDKTIKMKVIK